jgi:4-hydroxythreonine-4-phosphate dehydrogenase
LKTIGFEEGVNITLGLSFIRTSPDHGTAFDLAGQNIADETSTINAIKMAVSLSRKCKDG